jgi:hypothetical protein
MIMPTMNRFSPALAITLLAAAVFAAPAESTRQYDSGYHTMARLGDDLYRALPKEKRGTLLARPVLLDNIKLPYLQPGAQAKDGTNWNAVFVSPALFEVLNYISHARAVDLVDEGFFAKAVNSLACDNGDKGLPPLYQPTHEKSWAFNTMNGQLSYFNQMAAGLLAIEMAHHHLGHYTKYAGQLGDPKKPAPLYSVLSQKEWREAVLGGSRHALDCGLAPEGLIVLYDAISRMPQRPSWAIHLMPPTAEVSILRLELKRVEASFFDSRSASREEFRWSW